MTKPAGTPTSSPVVARAKETYPSLAVVHEQSCSIPICRPDLPGLDEFTAILEGIWDTRVLTNFGPISRRLEAAAARYLDITHVRATASGDIGLMATIKALGLEPGSPCFVSPYTFNSTINTALWNRLLPIFVDVDRQSHNMDPAALRRAMADTGERGVILATHVFGTPCDTEALTELAADGGHLLIFDAAHALGAEHRGAKVGTFGDAEMFSLSGTKLVTSAEGGLIATRHDWLADRLEKVRGYGFRNDYRSEIVGLNGKMSEIHAALGLLNLDRIDDILEARATHIATYHDALSSHVGWQTVLDGDRSTTKDLVIHLGSRRAIVESALSSARVQTKRYFVPLHHMAAYSGYANRPLPQAERAYEESLCIPLYATMTTTEVAYVCDVIVSTLTG